MKRWPSDLLDTAEKATPPRPVKPTLRRYSWCRLHQDVITSDLLGLVADMAASDRATVEAMVVRLDLFASGNQPRGSVLGFNVPALAVTWRRDRDELARILAALEHPDIGWLDQDCVVTFWARNPDHEDPTAADRMQRYRARQRNRREAERRQLAGFPQQDESVTRNAVTVTTRPEQTDKVASEGGKLPGAAPQAIHGESGITGEKPVEPVLWLATEGRRIVVQRLNETPPKAQQRIERWQEKIGGDLAALAAILDRLDATDLVVAQFLVEVTNAIDRHLHQLNGPQLPLVGIVGQRRRASGE